ncbi:Sgf29p [Sugiyamaella lignohabitans]|uniref:Sgf29p n=1 Tax=Sugiyamaella lignohabitans TaxID=796027 RepID=A0A167FLV3_9ASCO|nr:Sgf29p [Sugiyamaella lignohabitans]ANB15463.1 Sgf29p [Sugiyamaella lignohabitans]
MTTLISSAQSISEASTPQFAGSSGSGGTVNISGTLGSNALKKRRRGLDEHAGKTTFNKRGKLGSSSSYSSSSSASAVDNPSSVSDPANIHVGTQVAFRLRKHKGGEEEWIQCEVTKVITEGIRFEVQDPEPDENNNPGQSYKAGIRDIIVVPIDQDNTSLPPFPPHTIVLARYPETTTFYRAEVIDSSKKEGKCRLKFEGEEEEGKETEVERRLVLPIR